MSEVKNYRVYKELNESNVEFDDNKMIFYVEPDEQSMDGIEFYFNENFIEKKFGNSAVIAKSVKVSGPLLCYWNWMMTTAGCPEYYCECGEPRDISAFTMSGANGAFGFSGYSPAEKKIKIVLTYEIK